MAKPKKRNLLKKAVVLWLFETYGGRHGIPSRRGAKGLSAECKKLGVEISPGTFRNIFNGAPGKLAPETREQLAELFRRAIPGMKPSWFDRETLGENPLENFQALCRNAAVDESEVILRVPHLKHERMEVYKGWLRGLYICYRYSFQTNDDDSVARELLRVWYDKDEGTFKFGLWYVTGGEKPGSHVDSLSGSILLVNDMIMFVGVSGDRARSMFWTYDSSEEAQGDFKYCRFGITTSAKIGQYQAPVTACTVCIKLEKEEPEDLEWWCSEKSMIIGVDKFKDIIGKDFDGEISNEGRTSHRTPEEWIKLFLENRPMTKEHSGNEADDRILRLNLPRFRIRMEPIRKEIIANKKLAPFNMDIWKREKSRET
jgi:hypothetical protein